MTTLTDTLAALEMATPGEWWVEYFRSDAGFDAFQIRSDENKPLLDTLNSEVACVRTETHEDGTDVYDETGYADLQAVAAAVNFLRSPEFAELVADKARLDAIQSEYWKVDPFALPTPGGDDADVGWRVSSYYQAEPKECEVATEYSDNLRTAIDQAIAKGSQT